MTILPLNLLIHRLRPFWMRRFAQISATMEDNQALLQRLRASDIQCQRLLQQITLLKLEFKDAKLAILKKWQNALRAKEKEWVVKYDEQIRALLQIIQHQEQTQALLQEELSELRSQPANVLAPATVNCSTQTSCQMQGFRDDDVRRGTQSKHRISTASMQVCTTASFSLHAFE